MSNQSASRKPGERPFRTVKELLSWTEEYFREQDILSPRLDAELLLAAVLNTERLELYTGYDKPVEPEERARFRELVRRRARREPVAYLVGEREFYSLSFRVTPDVLIPRAETEHVVEEALDLLSHAARNSSRSTPLRLLDIGTGSGNLAVAIAANDPDVLVDALDTHHRILDVARHNAQRHGVAERVRFLRGNLFRCEDVEERASGELAAETGISGPYRVIVSNPPYVRADEIEALMPEIRTYEPREALVDCKSPTGDGLGFYRAIAKQAPDYLARKGAVVVEVGDNQASDAAQIFRNEGFSAVRTREDYGQVERVVVAQRHRTDPPRLS